MKEYKNQCYRDSVIQFAGFALVFLTALWDIRLYQISDKVYNIVFATINFMLAARLLMNCFNELMEIWRMNRVINNIIPRIIEETKDDKLKELKKKLENTDTMQDYVEVFDLVVKRTDEIKDKIRRT